MIQNFDSENEQCLVGIRTLKVTFSNKIEQLKLLDNQILSLLKAEKSENEFDELWYKRT